MTQSSRIYPNNVQIHIQWHSAVVYILTMYKYTFNDTVVYILTMYKYTFNDTVVYILTMYKYTFNDTVQSYIF